MGTKYKGKYNLILRGEDAEICSYHADDRAAIDTRYRDYRNYAAVKGREVIVRTQDHRIAALACWSTLLWIEDVPSPQSVFKPKGYDGLTGKLKVLYSYLIGTQADLHYACEQSGIYIKSLPWLESIRGQLMGEGGLFQCNGCTFWCSTNDLAVVDCSAEPEYVCEDCDHWRRRGYL